MALTRNDRLPGCCAGRLSRSKVSVDPCNEGYVSSGPPDNPPIGYSRQSPGVKPSAVTTSLRAETTAVGPNVGAFRSQRIAPSNIFLSWFTNTDKSPPRFADDLRLTRSQVGCCTNLASYRTDMLCYTYLSPRGPSSGFIWSDTRLRHVASSGPNLKSGGGLSHLCMRFRTQITADTHGPISKRDRVVPSEV